MLNLDSVLAEKRLALEQIDDPGLLYRLTLETTRDAEAAEDKAIALIDQNMRQSGR